MKPIRLVLYDEHPIITDAIQHYLSQYYNVKVQKICCSVEDLLNHLKDHQVDIIITGILSSDEIGISLISQIKKLNKMAKIIAFSSISSSITIQTIMEAGADAFVSKKTGIENLYNKIMEVNLKEKNPCTNIKPTVKLTNKEKNIINLLKQGKSSKEISEITCTSANTINNQKNHLIDKFCCSNSNELITKLISMGYLEI